VVLAFLLKPALAPLAAQDGQQKPTDDNSQEWFQVHEKGRKFTTADFLKKFDAPIEESYTLGRGDDIVLTVWGRPELSGKQVIGPDGRITLPIIGSIKVADLTREAASDAVIHALEKDYTNLSVSIQVERYGSNRVFIVGRVANPGALLFDRPPTLLEAIARAGSLPVGGMGSEKAALTRCAIFRGRDQIAWIDLKALFTAADLSLNIHLHRDDVVYLPDADDQLVYVMGEVRTPGALHLTPDMSFLDAIARSGGTTVDAATAKIQLIRPGRDLHRDISLKALMQPDPSLKFSLEEGDIIYVPRTNMAKIGYSLERLGPIGGLIVVGAALLK
jgi:polysaccharide export outer membrane protein